MTKKTRGSIVAGCGALTLLSSLAVFAIFFYLGVIENRGVSTEEATPALGGGCCCSLISLVIIGVGVFLAVRKPPNQQPT